jgi:hypothetical protein
MFQAARQFCADAELKRPPLSHRRGNFRGWIDSQDRWLCFYGSAATSPATSHGSTCVIGCVRDHRNLIPADALNLHECLIGMKQRR